MLGMKQKRRGQSGFTMVELLIAMVIFVVGVLAVSALILYGIRLQAFSRDATMANAVAKQKIEQLRVSPPGDPQRALGGDLDNNIADHFDIPQGTAFIRRWVVAPGPAGTQDVTVAVVPSNPNMRLPPVQIRVLLEP